MSRTPSLRWEWTLANGARVAAELDTKYGREAVFVEARVASEVARGTKPDGHTVVAGAGEPIEAVVKFEPNTPICILRVDGFEVAPVKWPVPQRRALESPPARSGLPRWLIALAAVVVVAAGALVLRSAAAPGGGQLTASHRAENGLFIAHYPPPLKLRPVILPAPLGGILLEDDAAHEAIIIAAFTLDSTIAPDSWVLQQRFHDEVLANIPKAARTYVQTDRREGKCLGEPGAVITGGIDRPDGARARIWSCAFVKEGRGYFVLYALPEASGDARLRKIVEGTELTRLASIGSP